MEVSNWMTFSLTTSSVKVGLKSVRIEVKFRLQEILISWLIMESPSFCSEDPQATQDQIFTSTKSLKMNGSRWFIKMESFQTRDFAMWE